MLLAILGSAHVEVRQMPLIVKLMEKYHIEFVEGQQCRTNIFVKSEKGELLSYCVHFEIDLNPAVVSGLNVNQVNGPVMKFKEELLSLGGVYLGNCPECDKSDQVDTLKAQTSKMLPVFLLPRVS